MDTILCFTSIVVFPVILLVVWIRRRQNHATPRTRTLRLWFLLSLLTPVIVALLVFPWRDPTHLSLIAGTVTLLSCGVPIGVGLQFRNARRLDQIGELTAAQNVQTYTGRDKNIRLARYAYHKDFIGTATLDEKTWQAVRDALREKTAANTRAEAADVMVRYLPDAPRVHRLEILQPETLSAR